MKLSSLLGVLCAMALLHTAQAQTATLPPLHPHIMAAFEKPYLERIAQSQPWLLQRYAFFLTHGYEIQTYPAEKELPSARVIELPDTEHFNIFLLMREQKLTTDREQKTYYRIKGTRKLLAFLPTRQFDALFKESLKTK